MRQYVLISLLLVVGIVLVSCGPKRVRDRVIKNLPAQKQDASIKSVDPFADLSLDDIRNNAEFFDSASVASGDVPCDNSRQMLSDEYEARLIDIAIPFGARLLDAYTDNENKNNEMVFSYVTPMSMEQVVAFYNEQMERLGWSCARHVRGHEQLLLFERPDRSCSITLRSTAHPKRVDMRFTKIVIFIANTARR